MSDPQNTEPRDYTFLPGLLKEIADVAGLDAALKIADAKGGARVYFPARAPDGHWLVELIGREAANKLCQHFRVTARGGIELLVPLGPRGLHANARRRFVQLVEEGVSVEEACRRVGIHRATACRWRARMKDEENSRQLKLL